MRPVEQADREHVPTQGGRPARSWAKERRAWAERPGLWKVYLLQTTCTCVQVVLALLRGDRWFPVVAGLGALVCAVLTGLAYRGAHPREVALPHRGD